MKLSEKAIRDVNLMANNKSISVGMISDEYDIGATKKHRQVVPIYDSRIHTYIAEKAKERAKNGFHTFILLSGPRRTGKTTNAVTIARKIDPNFPVENICFRVEDFRKRLGTMPPTDVEKDFYSVGILDEAGVDLYSKDWQHRAVKEMGKVMQVIGKKCQTVIMCLPHRNLLVGDIREAMDFWIVTITLDGFRGFAELREGCYNKWKLNLFWKPLCGFVFEELDDPAWRDYETRKDIFIEEFIMQDTKMPQSSKVSLLINQRDTLVRLIARDPKYTQIQLADLVGMRKENICRIVNER